MFLKLTHIHSLKHLEGWRFGCRGHFCSPQGEFPLLDTAKKHLTIYAVKKLKTLRESFFNQTLQVCAWMSGDTAWTEWKNSIKAATADSFDTWEVRKAFIFFCLLVTGKSAPLALISACCPSERSFLLSDGSIRLVQTELFYQNILLSDAVTDYTVLMII